MKNQARGATVTATNRMTLLFLDKQKFTDLFSSGIAKLNVRFAKRAAVSAENDAGNNTHLESTAPPDAVREKSEALRNAIFTALGNHPLCSSYSSQHVSLIVEAMWKQEVPSETNIITQGEHGDNLYFVETGSLDVIKDGNKIFTKRPNMLIGELALMYNAFRSASVRAAEECVLWVVDRFTFRRILTDVSKKELELREAKLKQIPLLAPLSSQERSKIAEALERKEYPDGTELIKQGEDGDAMYIITKGVVRVVKEIKGKTVELVGLKENDFFGERALLTNEKRAASCFCKGEVAVLRLDSAAFFLLLGPLSDILNERKMAYDKINKQKAAEITANSASTATTTPETTETTPFTATAPTPNTNGTTTDTPTIAEAPIPTPEAPPSDAQAAKTEPTPQVLKPIRMSAHSPAPSVLRSNV